MFSIERFDQNELLSLLHCFFFFDGLDVSMSPMFSQLLSQSERQLTTLDVRFKL